MRKIKRRLALCPVDSCKAECCGAAPMPRVLYEAHVSELQREVEVFTPYGIPSDFVVAIDSDMNCGFLRADFKCAIYANRPDICRKFGDHAKYPCPIKQMKGM